MSSVDWRIWLFDRLRENTGVTELVPVESMYGAGSLEASPADKPFVVIHVGSEVTEIPGISRTMATVWAHDEVGNYLTIDDLLQRVRNTLCGNGETTGQVLTSGGIAARWVGDGPDQSDPVLGTLMRSSTYRLLGRNGNV